MIPRTPQRWLVTRDGRGSAAVAAAAEVNGQGGVIAYPTDTLYGLGAHPWIPPAVDRLFTIKGRAADVAVPLLAADLEQVEANLGRLSTLANRLARAFWPGPLTLVVPAPTSLPRALLGGGETVAIRVPAHPVAVELARAVGVPITSTSANRSGRAATNEPGEVVEALGEDLDGILDAGASPGGAPSTLVDVTGESPRLVRAGAIAWSRVVQFLST